MTPTEAAAYIAAFIDGEGHISCTATRRGRFTKAIAFSNTDKQLFDRVVDLCESLNITMRVYFTKSSRDKWSDKWVAYVSGGRQTFEHFAKIIPLQCERKKAKLHDLLESYRSKEYLEELYKRKSTSICIKCPICGADFMAFPADIKRGQGKYCSHACACKARTIRIEKICIHCGTTFFVNRARDKTAFFCSHRCVGLSQSSRIAGMAGMAAKARWG